VTSRDDRYDLARFVDAQQGVYETAIAEIRAGRKRSHWMWYVFPQVLGLGSSAMAQHYGIRDEEEARAYLAHPVLGQRLIECAEAICSVTGRSAREILGTPDDLKLRSCATLFAQVSPPGSVFDRVLRRYYDGQPDQATLALLRPQET
jgi:uncharacterized protein (DUF1810 family)